MLSNLMTVDVLVKDESILDAQQLQGSFRTMRYCIVMNLYEWGVIVS